MYHEAAAVAFLIVSVFGRVSCLDGSQDSFALKNVSRSVPSDGMVFISVEFQASRLPDIKWNGADLGEIKTKFAGGEGSTELLLLSVSTNDVRYVSLEIGFFDTQYYDVGLRVVASADSRTLDMHPTTFSPSTNVSYSGEVDKVEVSVVAGKKLFEGAVENGRIWMHGAWFNSDSSKIEMFEYPSVDFISTDQTESSTERTTRLTIDTQPAINGWFKVALNGDTKAPWDDDGVLSGISEYTWLLVHLDIYSGPFPDNLITVTSQQDVLGCIPGYTYNCEISCDASGNSVKSFRVYKESEDGQQDVTDVEKYVERFKQIVTAKLDMEGNFDGDYVCEADDGQGNSQRHRVQVMELETPASVEIDRGNIETLENGDIKITCQGSGSQPLTTIFTWGGEELTVGEHSVVSYSRAQGGDNIATVVLRKPLDKNYIWCEASNPASSYYDYMAIY